MVAAAQSPKAKKPQQHVRIVPPKGRDDGLLPQSAGELKKLLRLIPGYDPFQDAGEYWFDREAAEKPLLFFKRFVRHTKGDFAGKPFDLQPWQVAIVANIFGWKRKDGKRRYRESFILVPRKNGKTTLLAGIVAYVLLCDPEPGSELYGAAASRKQAKLLFKQVKEIIQADKNLRSLSGLKIWSNSIERGSRVYQPLSADAGTQHGFNSHLIVIDELHAQKKRDLVDALTTSTPARSQPITIFITTADVARRVSICNEKHKEAREVRDRLRLKPDFLPVIYEALVTDDWESVETWKKANPNFGVSVNEDYIRDACERAKATPSYLNTFLQLHLNVQTHNEVAWLRMDRWDEAPTIDPSKLWGRPCWAGVDLSTTRDLSCVSLVFEPLEPNGPYSALAHFFAPMEKAREREKRDQVPYLTWHRQGFLTLCEGDVVDYEVVRRYINEAHEIYEIKEIAYDKWTAPQLATQLQGDGFELFEFRQNFRNYSAPCKEFEALVASRRFVHFDNPILKWNAANTFVDRDAYDNIKPNKKRSTDRIDGIPATLMGLGRFLIQPPPPPPSVYETRGFRVL